MFYEKTLLLMFQIMRRFGYSFLLILLACNFTIIGVYSISPIQTLISGSLNIIPCRTMVITLSVEADSQSVIQDAEFKLCGAGEYIIGDEARLSATPEEDTGVEFTYIWYAKNASGEWEQVSTNTTYTFMVSADSATEYKVVYVSEDEKIQISVVTEAQGTPPSEYGVDYEIEYSIGDTVTFTGYVSNDCSSTWAMIIFYKDSDGSWIYARNASIQPYSFILTEDSPTEYKVRFVFEESPVD